MAEETVVIRFTGDASSVEQAANQASRAVDGLEGTTKTAGKGFDVLGEIASGALRRIGEAAINAVGTGLAKIGEFFTDSIKEATEFQNVFAQTEAVIKSTGMAAGLTAEDLANLASDLSAASGMSMFSDDAILSATNMLATFKEIKGVKFEEATSAILDLSQAMGQDLKSSTIQIGKALNDPIGGISALSRVGIQFTEDQKAMIESLVNMGDVAGAQTIILDELNSQFGGSAAAAVDTYAGQMRVLEEQFNDVKQSVGEALLPILQKLGQAAVQYVVPAVEQVATAFADWINSVDWVGFVSLVDSVFSSLVGGVTSVDWDGVFTSITNAIDYVVLTANKLQTAFNTAVSAIMAQVNIFWGIVGPVWTQFVAVLQQAYTQLAPLGQVFNSALGDVTKQGQAMAPIGEFLGNIAKAILNVAGFLIEVLVPVIKFVFPLFVQYIQSVIEGYMRIYNTIQYVFSGQLQKDVVNWWITTVTNIVTVISDLITKARQIGTDLVTGIANGIRGAGNALRDAFAATIGDAVAFAKRILGIASPSKVMAEVIGRPIGQGIAAGIASTVGDVTGALAGTVGASAAATQQTVQNFYLTANYATAQSQSDIMTDLRAAQILAGGI